MAGSTVRRKLVAILAADIAGYSRVMRADEESALRTLASCRKLVEDRIAEHHGRVFAASGDGLLAEFASAVDAVRAAVRIQAAIARYNAMLPQERRMHYRIGINLGDVVVDGRDLLGDGVNVAARLEAIAPPEGIVISGSAFDQIEGKVGYDFAFQGELELKNIDRPVRVYRLGEAPTEAAASLAGLLPRRSGRSQAYLASAAVLLFGLGALGLWALPDAWPLGPKSLVSTLHDGAPVLDDAPVLPAEPSIAVLPVALAVDDATLARFAGGLTDGLITQLTRFPGLLVIARGSVEAYAGNSVDPRAIGRELGVRFVLESQLAREAERLRLRAHLVDTANGYTVWAEQYDRPWADLLEVQDDLTATVVASLGGWDSEIARAERQRLRHRPTGDLAAYEHMLIAATHYAAYTRVDNRAARRAAMRAIEADRHYALAYAYVAWTHLGDFWWLWSEDPDASVAQAHIWATRAVEIDPQEYNAHWVLGDVYQATGDWERARTAYDRALALNPNDAELLQDYGSWILPMAGEAEAGIAHTTRAMRLHPRHPERYFGNLALNHYLVGDYEAAASAVLRMTTPRFDHRLYAAAALARLGRADDAAREIDLVARERPDMTVQRFMATLPFRDREDAEHVAEGLRLAGLRG